MQTKQQDALQFHTVKKRSAICWHFKKKGFCTFEQCKFTHVKDDDHNIHSDHSHNHPLMYYMYRVKEEKSVCSVLRRTFEENGFKSLQPRHKHMDLSPLNITVFWGNQYPSFNVPSDTMINHFPTSHQLTNKSLLTTNLQHVPDFPYLPTSFVLPKQMKEFTLFNQKHGKYEKVYWIMKPLSSGEGRGIRIVGDYNEILNEEPEDGNKKRRKCIVSRYVRNPLLIDGKKFDLRLYVLLCGGRSSNDLDQIYLYCDGIVRFASESYADDISTLQNEFMHITNNTVNDKKNRCQNHTESQTFGFYQNITLKELRDYFADHSLSFDTFWNHLKVLVKKSVNLTMYNTSLQDELFNATKHRCFELLGFDVLIDDHLFPFLLEVNAMPDLDSTANSGTLVLDKDFDVKSKLLATSLNIAFDKSQNVSLLGEFEKIQ